MLTDGHDRHRPEGYLEGNFATTAFFAVVALAYLTMFVAAYTGSGRGYPWWVIAILIILGVLYGYLTLNPEILTARFSPAVGYSLYFAIIFGLALLIGWLAEAQGQIWLLILPPIGQAAELSRPMTLSVSLVALVVGWLIFYLELGYWEYQIPLFMLPAIIFVAAFSYIAFRERTTRTEIEALAVELSRANHKLSEYAAEIEELAVMRERNRLAREIHDSLGHYLTVVNVQIGAAKAVMDQDQARAADVLDKAQRLTQEGLAEVRQSVAMLRESREDRPLAETLPALIDVTRTAGIESTLTILGEPRPLPSRVSRALYRAVQEGLTNVRRHSEASRVDITLSYEAPAVVGLRIKDNGRGTANSDGGFGIVGIQERVNLLGGQVRIVTEVGRGFELEIAIPTVPNAKQEEADEQPDSRAAG